MGDISLFKQFLVSEFGEEMCGEAGHLDIGYFKGNKRVWMRTNDDYLKTLDVKGVQSLCGVNVV